MKLAQMGERQRKKFIIICQIGELSEFNLDVRVILHFRDSYFHEVMDSLKNEGVIQKWNVMNHIYCN